MSARRVVPNGIVPRGIVPSGIVPSGRVPNASRRGSPARPGVRRGATLALVCVLLTVLVGFTAFAVDLGRLYYAGAELQTAADAAALGAMRYHQYTTTLSVTGIQAQAAWMASLNHAGNQPAQVLAGDVVPMTYNRTTAKLAGSTWSIETAAIQVTAQTSVRSIFAEVMGDSVRVVRRAATAWLANVNGAGCVRPFVINYTRFYEEALTWDSRYTSVRKTAPDFTHVNIASVGTSTLPGRTFIILPPGNKESVSDARGFTANGNWRATALGGAGTSAFASAIGASESGPDCQGTRATVGDTKAGLVADSASVLAAMNAGMGQLCHRRGGDAHCYGADGSVGVKTRVVFGDSVAASGSFAMKVREVGVVRIMCYFQAPTDVCNDVQLSEPEVKGTWSSYGPRTGYPAGTVELFLDTPGSTTITSDIVLGTKPGLTQRLLLVK